MENMFPCSLNSNLDVSDHCTMKRFFRQAIFVPFCLDWRDQAFSAIAGGPGGGDVMSSNR